MGSTILILDYFSKYIDEGGRRGHGQKLFKKRFRLDVRKNIFLIELLIIGICPRQLRQL